MKYNSSHHDDSRRSGSSSQRRGSRSNSGGRSRDHRSRPSAGNRENPAAPAPKPTFWQKLLSLFSGRKTATASTNHRRFESPAESRRDDRDSRTEHPAYRRNGGGENSSASEQRIARKPERIEVTSPKLYVGNLSYEATESDLVELFNGVGKVRNAEVVSNPHTQRSKGFAFVQMETTDEAKRAVLELHDQDFMGRKLVVSGAKTSDAHASSTERTAA